jgi:hypothetical protein
MTDMRGLGRHAAGCLLVFTLILPTFADVVRVETSLNGNKLELVELEVTSGNDFNYPNRVVPFANLVATTIADFVSVTESNAANSVTILATPDASPPLGSDRLLFLGDQYLNTGIFNPTYGTPGIHVAFQRPVINGPGVDFVAFELTIGSGQTPDPIEILQLDNVGSILNVASRDYQLQGTIPAEAAPRTFEATVDQGGAAGFETLRDATLNLVGTVVNPKWHAISIDFDALGVPEWGSVTGLYLLSDNVARNTPVDLLMVAGLPPVFRPGDYDGDYDVDGRDFLIWQREYGLGFGSPADGTLDGIVDSNDLVLWQQHYQGASLVAARVAIPEPTTLIVAVTLGVHIVALLRRG